VELKNLDGRLPAAPRSVSSISRPAGLRRASFPPPENDFKLVATLIEIQNTRAVFGFKGSRQTKFVSVLMKIQDLF
jgi:hypothetical protein